MLWRVIILNDGFRMGTLFKYFKLLMTNLESRFPREMIIKICAFAKKFQIFPCLSNNLLQS